MDAAGEGADEVNWEGSVDRRPRSWAGQGPEEAPAQLRGPSSTLRDDRKVEGRTGERLRGRGYMDV